MQRSSLFAGTAGLSSAAHCAAIAWLCAGLSAQQLDRRLVNVGPAGIMVATEPSTDTVLALDWGDQKLVSRRFDGSSFELVTVAGPVNRNFSAFAGCSGTELLLFGGTAGGGVAMGDTWVWSGTAWQPLQPATSPSARYGAGCAQLAGGVAVLFGGVDGNGTRNNETWTFDGAQWVQVSTANSPSARDGAAMCSDGLGNVLLHGGNDGSGPLQDTWLFDGANWTLATTTGPSRAYAGMALDQLPDIFGGGVRNEVILLGGTNGPQPVWRYASGAWDVVPAITFNSTTPAGEASVAADAVRDTIIVVESLLLGGDAFSCGTSFSSFGINCCTGMQLAGGGTPALGATYSVDVTGGTPNDIVWVASDPNPAPDGIALDGFPVTCLGYIGNGVVAVLEPRFLDANGDLSIPIPVASDPSLLGTRAYYQVADLNVGSPVNPCVTDALEVRIGN